jgi:hypothetical protein
MMCLASTKKEIKNFSAITDPGTFQHFYILCASKKQQILRGSMSVKSCRPFLEMQKLSAMEKTNAHSGSGYHALHVAFNLASFSGSWASITYQSSSWPPETNPFFEEEPVTSTELVETGETPVIDFNARK